MSFHVIMINPDAEPDPAHVPQWVILSKRILELIPTHPEIMSMSTCHDLLNLPDLKIDDLDLMVFEAQTALEHAQKEYNA